MNNAAVWLFELLCLVSDPNYIFRHIAKRFIMTEEDDMNHSWEHKLVKRYYDKLFKEYPLL